MYTSSTLRNLRIIFLLLCASQCKSELKLNTTEVIVKVNKCCEANEFYKGKSCMQADKNESLWKPLFSNDEGQTNIHVNYRLVFGMPDCASKQPWPIFHNQRSTDYLKLLPNGVLRHYLDHPDLFEGYTNTLNNGQLFYQDYKPGNYCLEKSVVEENVNQFAWVCVKDTNDYWTSSEFLMRNVINVITHGLGICCLLTVAVIYFIMPTLKDLTGNIVTTICMCLILSQSADILRLLTVFDHHVSLMIADILCYFGLLGAFFWLNSLGYYISKTFGARNVFIRITDAKKYCYYASYAWSCTLVLTLLAVFSHFALDYNTLIHLLPQIDEQREEIGSLGIIIFFVPIAITILMDVLFFVTTVRTMNRLHTYGRIHHKLRHSFRMFILLLLVMSITWIFFLLSFFKFAGLINAYIIVNAFQGPIILYICIINQKHVTYLVRKTFCYNNCYCRCCRPEPETDWGDEMTSMNTGYY